MFLFSTPSRDRKKKVKDQKDKYQDLQELILFYYASNLNN